MSLTSHLNNPRSPVYRFMRERFPYASSFVRAVNKEMKGTKTIRPEGQVDWSTIGTAVDYRLRYYFGVTPKEAMTAWIGAIMVERGMIREAVEEDPDHLVKLLQVTEAAKVMIPEFFSKLEDALSRLRPEHRRLGEDSEELLARYCVGLALFEQVYRRGRIPQRSLLTFPKPVSSTSDLLARVPQLWVDDLRSLSWAFYDECQELLSRPAVLNPTFDGSRDVGGADADLIVDRAMCCSTTPTSMVWVRPVSTSPGNRECSIGRSVS